MSYEPTNWKKGDVVTSEKLNKIENGIAAVGVLVCTADAETGSLNHTWQEIHDAGFAVLRDSYDVITVSMIAYDAEMGYGVVFGNNTYLTETADGYPVFDNGGGDNGGGNGMDAS